tara:strand:- start:151 stop:534 length:384 start_codon:yes stop_codon:yes gene_type:complete
MEKLKAGSNKSFGIVFFVFFLAVAIYPIFFDGNLRVWSLIISFIFLILGLINSNLLTPLNLLWFKFGMLLGKIVSPIVMGFVFFLVVTPTGYIMRFLNKDLLRLKRKNINSYWIERTPIKTTMKDQF